MSNLFDKVLNFVGWEVDEEEILEEQEVEKEEVVQPQFMQSIPRKQQGKVVSFHSTNQFKVVIMQPETFDDAQDICDHLKNKKPVVVNLEDMDKDNAQRVIDFLSGSIYALDGHIQKVSNGIFIIAPNNVDLMGDVKEELQSKGVFPWAK